MGKLKGKVAVVTGASKGIGAGIARALGAEGAAVVVNYASDQAGAERVVAEIVARDGRAIAEQADTSKREHVARLFIETIKAFGAVHVLVNNAGVFQFDALEGVSEAEFHREFDTNVLGPFLTAQEAQKHFKDGGNIINISSVVSMNRLPNSVVYSATKSALDQVTRVLAVELGPKKIRVNAINPGPVDTEGTRAIGFIGHGGEMEKQMVASTPLGRIGRPDDIGRVATFLASDDSAWINGEVIAVSGGFR
jgi:3-oxoacyl-[acyl-carrier protein] reductase